MKKLSTYYEVNLHRIIKQVTIVIKKNNLRGGEPEKNFKLKLERMGINNGLFYV